jgi:hypothetical protein
MDASEQLIVEQKNNSQADRVGSGRGAGGGDLPLVGSGLGRNRIIDIGKVGSARGIRSQRMSGCWAGLG